MFEPKFLLNNRILNNIVKTEKDLFFLKSIDIPLEWVGKLKLETYSKRMYFGLKSEGVDANLELLNKVLVDDPARDESLMDLANRLGLVVKESELQAVLNMFNANKYVEQVGYIANRFSQEPLSLKEIFQLNKIIGERLVLPDKLGTFRKNQEPANLKHHPYTHEVPYQVEDLLLWVKQSKSENVNTLLRFAVTFCELMRIVPLEIHNTETCLLFCFTILIADGYAMEYVSLEEEFFRRRKVFGELMIESVEKNDLAALVEYVTEILAVAVEKTKSRIENVENFSVKFRTSGGRAVALSERQLVIMEEVTTKDAATIRQIREVLPMVSDDTILRDIKDLVLKKMIKRKGKTKGAVYVLGKVKNVY